MLNKPSRLDMMKGSGDAIPSRCGSTQKMAANIKVVVRVRPPNSKELENNNRIIIDVVDDKMLVFDPKEEHRPFFYQGVQQPNRNYLKRANKELKFAFDYVCDQDATNMVVFERTTKEILASLMEGYNCSVFAYGATGAGKTFTMIGSLESPGITYLTMEHLFYSIDSYEKDREFEIAVSYIEVYNENVYDLLKPSKKPLQLREDSKYGVMVAGLTLFNIKTARELLNMLENGNKNRTQHPTDANAESSRSHAVFQVYIKMRNRISNQVRMVKLSMIDLAGSERASATGCVGARFKEGANINRSLLSLGNCINKLADASNYIPYRDSKLTRLLKDSLGGNCKTVMIANISPSSLGYEDTYNTLKYAARANKIQLSIKKNIVDEQLRVSQYVKVNEDLKNKIKELEAKLSLSSMQPIVKEDLAKEKAKQEWIRQIEEEEISHSAAETHLLDLMSRQRVLALRHWLRTRTYSHITDLAHRSSIEAMEKMCTEDIPRQERAAENYLKQSVNLDALIMVSWNKWNKIQKKLQSLCNRAVTEYPELQYFVKFIQQASKNRQTIALSDMRLKLMTIQNDEISALSKSMTDTLFMIKKLYLTLKGYDKAPPALTEEYLEVMRKLKSAKTISWSDQGSETETSDPHFKFISTLNTDKPSSAPDVYPIKKEELNRTVDIVTDSDDVADTENKDVKLPVNKRKGTPIKLPNNETIIIDDSLENLDITRTMSSAKKLKKEIDDIAPDNENDHVIDPKDLNSTFVLAGKLDAAKVAIKTETAQPVKRGLSDRTNTLARTINFAENKARAVNTVKPVVGKALPFRRPNTAAVQPSYGGFGSSASRDGTPLQRNIQDSRNKTNVNEKTVGFKAVRARERVQNHPYSRPNFGARR